MGHRSPSRIGAALAADMDALAPDWVRSVFLGHPMARQVRVVDGSTEPNQISAGVLIGTAEPKRRPRFCVNIDLRLPTKYFLERTITAPREARRNLRKLAALDLRQRTPFGADDVFWQLGHPQTDNVSLTAPQWVIKRSDVEEWRCNLARHKFRLRHLYVEGERQPIATFAQDIAPGRRHIRRINGLLAACIASALLAGWLYPGWQAGRQAATLQFDLTAMRSEALRLRREVEALRSRDQEQANFLDTVLRRARLVDTLRELTRSLPDEVWAETVEFSPDRAIIYGNAASSAADLVLHLGSHPAFRNPRLSGPISKTQGNGERFEITVDLKDG